MQTIPIHQFRLELSDFISRIIADDERIKIADDSGAVVMISEADWNSLAETLKLLQDKIALSALLEGHQARKKGEKPGKSANQFFDEL